MIYLNIEDFVQSKYPSLLKLLMITILLVLIVFGEREIQQLMENSFIYREEEVR